MSARASLEQLAQLTLRQLRRVASEYGVSRYSRLRKNQLVEAIRVLAKGELSSSPSPGAATQEDVEATKFDVGQAQPMEKLADVDAGLPDLPGGYGQSRVVMLPRDPQWAYIYWDIPNDHKEALRRQGGQFLALRCYDVTDLDLNAQAPHSVQEYPCDEMARDWYLPVPVSDRDYLAEIGYRCADGRWLVLARSTSVRVPPVYPSDWIEDHFITVNWDEDLRGRQVFQLRTPAQQLATSTPGAGVESDNPIYAAIYGKAQSAEAMRVAGSLFGSQHMQAPHEQSVSSYIFPSGVGMWALPTLSGINMSGAGMMFSGAMPEAERKPRQFWLVADAELIVYGATEPDATVTIGGQPVKLNPDGTFRFQLAFRDGQLDYPIVAVAADGEQTRSITMEFERQTPNRNTNTREEAVPEWF
jgi:hypothetical protein